jgi:hypothetical protein
MTPTTTGSLAETGLAAGEFDPPPDAAADCPPVAEAWDPLLPLLLLEQAASIKAKTVASAMRKAALFTRLAECRCDIASP